MGDELRAAAERVRRVRQVEAEGYDLWNATHAVYGPTGHRNHSSARDERAVIDAYLAEYAADSGEPVTEEWLREIGFVGGDSFRVASGPVDAMGRAHLCFGFLPVPDDETPRAWSQYGHYTRFGNTERANVPIPMPATRGDVRRWLAALGASERATDGSAAG